MCPARGKTALDETRALYTAMRSELAARSLPLSRAAQRMGLTIEELNNSSAAR
jgi:hypothetical protein